MIYMAYAVTAGLLIFWTINVRTENAFAVIRPVGAGSCVSTKERSLVVCVDK